MRLFHRSAASRYAVAALRQLPLPVALYRADGDAFACVLANPAASALPPPDPAWWPACHQALATGVPTDLGPVPGDADRVVRAMPLADDAVALVYEASTSDAPVPVADSSAQDILDAITDVVLVYPITSAGPEPIVAFNQAAVDTYGYAPETLRTMRVHQLVDTNRFNASQAIEELMRRREGRWDSVHLTQDGRRIPMQTAARLFEYGGRLCVLAVCRDDSERRAFQRQLSRTNADLERRVAARTAELEAFTASLKRLHELTTNDHDTPHERARAYLDAGCEMFGLTHGILSAVYADPETGQLQYRVDAVRSPDDAIAVGTTVPLSDTFCDDVVEARATVAFRDAADDDRIACIAAHQQRGLRAFLGTPLWMGDRIVGTLNFSSATPRETDFAPYERELVEIMADAMSRRLRADHLESLAAAPA